MTSLRYPRKYQTAAIATLVIATWSASATSASASNTKVDVRRETGNITTIQIHTNIGNVSFQSAAGSVVTIKRTMSGSSAKMKQSFQSKNGTVALKDECKKRSTCFVDYEISGPASLKTDVEVGAGDVRLVGMSGDVTIDSGAGDVELLNAQSQNVIINNGAGSVNAVFSTPPKKVEIDSGVGSITVEVPAGSYRIDTEVGVGDTTVKGVTNDPKAERSITLSSGAGDITLATPE